MKHQDFSSDWISDAPVYHFECTTFNSLGEVESSNTFQISDNELTTDYSTLGTPVFERNLRHSAKEPKITTVIPTGAAVTWSNETGPFG
jgi:hypothetical protein